MICEPCRIPHRPDECIDAEAGRVYPWRWCFCQHLPYEHPNAASTAAEPEHQGEDQGEEKPEESAEAASSETSSPKQG